MKLCAEQKGIHCEIFLEELLAFIGLNLAMGLLRLPQVSDYWSKVEILETTWFPAVMSRDRFFFLLCYLHLVDSRQKKKKVKLGTIHYTKLDHL